MTTNNEHDGDQEFASAEAWGRIAAGYGEFVAPGEASFATAALDLVGLKRHESFLDVAAGTGGLSLPAARLGAKVLATDWAPEMIAQFEARAQDEGLDNVEGRVMDAHALELDDDLFDVTGSQFGVMLVPDQPTALREMVRVTKPGGRVLLIVLGPPADFEALQFFIEAMGTVVPGFHGLPDDPPPLEFQVADPEVLRARLTASGLDAVKIDTTHLERLEFGTGRDCWNWILNSNPIAGSILDEVAKADQAEGSRCPRPEDDSARGRARRRCPHLEAQHRMGLEGRLAMSPSILVVGGGIAGRAVARGLAQHELACTVVERRETAGRGMGVNLPGNAVRALGELGVPTEALARGVPVRRREYRNGGGRLLFAVDDARFWREVAPPVCLRHGDLLAALPLPEGITLEHAHAMTARPTPTDVEVELEGIGLRRFYFVIGADGVHSAMRGAIADDTLCPSSMTGSSWRFVTDNPGVDCWTAWSGRDATFLLIPVEENRVYGYAARTRCGHTGSDPMWLTQASAAFPTVVQTAVAQAVDAGELLKSGVDEVRIDHWQKRSDRAHRRRRTCHRAGVGPGCGDGFRGPTGPERATGTDL
jgi:2-polyprenyl-6-methoxyphenol hydroxylase-like FAD-dependent oxidoreductase/SAM-dependent methyltransferase